MKKMFSAIIILSIAGLLAACGDAAYDPVDLSETDQCYTCHMGIEDEQAATQSILTDGTPRFFDDIGCMLMYLQDTDDEVEVSYVMDHNAGEWLDLSDAYFVHDQNIQTPMSYGFIAFGSDQEAEEFISENGEGELLSGEEITAIDTASLEEWYSGHSEEHHDHGDHGEDDGDEEHDG
ncbi:nitrous oxide reductase accessory protein NosL [Virgibacillus kimchii]